MAQVIAHTKIKRNDKKFIYYVKSGGVWQAPRHGSKGGRKKKLVQFGPARMDYSKKIYFVDGRGNVAAASRKNSSGGRRRKARTASSGRQKKSYC